MEIFVLFIFDSVKLLGQPCKVMFSTVLVITARYYCGLCDINQQESA